MTSPDRNPHAGEPFTDGDDVVAAALNDVSVPALLCSLVHMTGDPSWIRGDIRPRVAISLEFQSGIPEDEQAEIRRRAVPVIAAYRDAGCQPHALSHELLVEMMEFMSLRSLTSSLEGMFFDDMQFEGGDSGTVSWGPEVPADARDASPVIVIGAGESGILAGIRLTQAGLPFTIIDKNDGPAAPGGRTAIPARASTSAATSTAISFEPTDHWSEYYCQQPELRDYFEDVVEKYGLAPTAGSAPRRLSSPGTSPPRAGGSRCKLPTAARRPSRPVSSSAPSERSISRICRRFRDARASPARRSTRRAGLRTSTSGGSRFALVGAGASGFQIAPTIADRVASLSIFQRTAQWIIPNMKYHAPVPPGEKWAQRHLPFYGRWFRFLMTFPGVAVGMESYRVDPDYQAAVGVAVNPINEERGQMLAAWMHPSSPSVLT